MTYKHKKTGKLYEVISMQGLRCCNESDDRREFVIYKEDERCNQYSGSGLFFFRNKEEFLKKFEKEEEERFDPNQIVHPSELEEISGITDKIKKLTSDLEKMISDNAEPEEIEKVLIERFDPKLSWLAQMDLGMMALTQARNNAWVRFKKEQMDAFWDAFNISGEKTQ